MTLTGLCQLELTKNLGPLCIAIGMLIIICSLGTADFTSEFEIVVKRTIVIVSLLSLTCTCSSCNSNFAMTTA